MIHTMRLQVKQLKSKHINRFLPAYNVSVKYKLKNTIYNENKILKIKYMLH